MQYQLGTISITNGSNSVSISGASSGAENVTVGDSFKVDRDGEAIYQVASRTPSSGATLTALTLSVNYAGVTGSGLGYQIVSDFTLNRGYPKVSQGDSDSADWISRALDEIDEDVQRALDLQVKTIEIGAWDMDTNPTVSVAHGLPDPMTIRGIYVGIKDDSITQNLVPLNSHTSGGAINGSFRPNGTSISLVRFAGGDFDSTDYNEGSGNRGYITIWYY